MLHLIPLFQGSRKRPFLNERYLPSIHLPKSLLLVTVEGLTEGQSTFSKHNLLTDAMKMGIGSHTYADFEKAFERLKARGEITVIGKVETQAGLKNVYSSKSMIAVESKVMEMCKTTKGTSNINVDRAATDQFIDHTDITLKMEVTLQVGEKDREKAEVKFKKFLSKVEDKDIRDRLTALREQALKAKENASLPKVIAEDHPELHQYFERGGYGFTPGQKRRCSFDCEHKRPIQRYSGGCRDG